MPEKTNISDIEVAKLLESEEGHFVELKSVDIAPAKLSRTICALSNADGGELYVGIEDNPRLWKGFDDQEAANAHIQVFEDLFPFADGYVYTFFENDNQKGLVLKIDIEKNRDSDR